MAETSDQDMTTRTFLYRLMLAESGGRDDARNPRSTATGPFQFIESTFLDVARRHFAHEIGGLTELQILSLRTDRAFAWRAAEAFTRDNAAALTAEGLPPRYPNLRLAFLLGPSAAVRILQAPPEAPVGPLLGMAVMVANPFMAGMTAADLVARAARDVMLAGRRVVARAAFVRLDRIGRPSGSLPLAHTPTSAATPSPTQRTAAERRRAPVLVVHCNKDLPSCRRWVAVHTRLLVARQSSGRRVLASAQR